MRPGLEAPENAVGHGPSALVLVASMRPGLEAPENRTPFVLGYVTPGGASMRPGLEAPENVVRALALFHRPIASMRPGLEAPENIDGQTTSSIIDGQLQ